MQALLHSYCCLDFASILDVTQLRLHKLRKLMKERVQNRCASGLSCRTDIGSFSTMGCISG